MRYIVSVGVLRTRCSLVQVDEQPSLSRLSFPLSSRRRRRRAKDDLAESLSRRRVVSVVSPPFESPHEAGRWTGSRGEPAVLSTGRVTCFARRDYYSSLVGSAGN